MSEHSAEAERVDEAVVSGGESSIEADVAASGSDSADAGVGADGAAEEDVTDSHAADVAAGFDDADDAPVQPRTEEDGTL